MSNTIVFIVLMTVVKYWLTYWFSALCHELAHALVGRHYGLRLLRLTFGFVVCSCSYANDKAMAAFKLRPAARFYMATAGWSAHAVIFALALGVLLYAGFDPDGFVTRLAIVNAVLLVFVAIPTGDSNQDADRAYKSIADMRHAAKRAASN